MDKSALATSLYSVLSDIGSSGVFDLTGLNFKGENLLLMILFKLGGKATPTEIIRSCDFTPARLTAICKKLEVKNCIVKTRGSLDKRQMIVELTEQGVQRLLKAQKEITDTAINLAEKLGEDDCSEFIRLLNKIAIIAKETGKDEVIVNEE